MNIQHPVPTHWSGVFAFFRPTETSALDRALQALHGRTVVLSALPLVPDWVEQLHGSLLPLAYAAGIALGGIPVEQANVAALAARPLGAETSGHQQLLTEVAIRDLHRSLFAGSTAWQSRNDVPGVYRKQPLEDAESSPAPKTLVDIRLIMDAFAIWGNSADLLALDPFLRAGLAHCHLLRIQPFQRGNNLVSLLLEAQLLRGTGLPWPPCLLWIWLHQHQRAYHDCINAVRAAKEDGELSFLALLLQGHLHAATVWQESAINLLRHLLLRQHIQMLQDKKHISQRQHELITLLLDIPGPYHAGQLKRTAPFKQLYVNRVERTIERDLQALCAVHLLARREDGYWVNWELFPGGGSGP
ncbi:Fic family protein [Megalodesulfovibrio paquesii]